jgi:energy-coupling factor transport system permease protein
MIERGEARGPDRPQGFHAVAWCLWAVAAAVVATAVESPFALPVLLGALAAVAGAAALPGPEARSFAALLRLGLVLAVARVVLFGLTGHAGATTLARLPEVRLPAWAGGLALGGPVTAEVLLQATLEGLRLAALLGVLGAFLSVTDLYRVLRLLPRFLTEAALVLTIGLAFAPTLARAAAEVRDAQRLRGHRLRGLRSLVPFATGVLAVALDRSVTLAESMEARGYGRRLEGAARLEARARALVLAGVLALAAGGALWLFDRGPRVATAVVALGGVGTVVAGCRALSRVVPRTRMRPERWTAWDVAVAGGAAATAAGAIALRALAPAQAVYAPHPRVAWPPLAPGPVAVAAAVALPAVLLACREALLARASRHPTTAAPAATAPPAAAPAAAARDAARPRRPAGARP